MEKDFSPGKILRLVVDNPEIQNYKDLARALKCSIPTVHHHLAPSPERKKKIKEILKDRRSDGPRALVEGAEKMMIFGVILKELLPFFSNITHQGAGQMMDFYGTGMVRTGRGPTKDIRMILLGIRNPKVTNWRALTTFIGDRSGKSERRKIKYTLQEFGISVDVVDRLFRLRRRKARIQMSSFNGKGPSSA